MNVQVVQLSQRKLVGIRNLGPYPTIGAKFEMLWEWTQKFNISYDKMLGIYYDNPREIEASKLRADACVVVPNDFVLIKGQNWDNEPLHETAIPFGDYAKYTHVGSYDQLEQVWSEFMSATERLGRQMADPTFELYVNDPGDTPAHQLITELYIRVQ